MVFHTYRVEEKKKKKEQQKDHKVAKKNGTNYFDKAIEEKLISV